MAMHIVSYVLLLALAAGAPAAVQAQTPTPIPAYVAGQSGWTGDTAGGGLVTLRTTLIPKAGLAPGDRPGFVLVLCTASQDRVVFDVNPSGSVRTVEPVSNGTAVLSAIPAPGQKEEPRRFITGLKVFPSGSFEISDLATGERNVARSLVAAVAGGSARFRLRLSGLPVEARFERDRNLTIDFVVAKADKPVLEQFETGCKLLGYARP